MRVVTLVAKGPSSALADECIACTGSDVAVVNDAMRVVRRERINVCAFMDFEMAERAREYWHRVDRFLCPDRLHLDQVISERTAADLPEFPMDRCTQVEYDCRDLDDSKVVKRLVADRRPVLGFTASMLHAWLAYSGYDVIVIVGVDGGSAYHPDMHGMPLREGQTELPNYDCRLRSHRVLARELRARLGVRTVWYTELRGRSLQSFLQRRTARGRPIRTIGPSTRARRSST
jgi:hypothetical protein